MSADYALDPRALALVTRTPQGWRSLRRADLEGVADRWPTSPHTPEGVERQLHVVRQPFTHSLLVWEFGAVVAATARFEELVDQAHASHLVDDDMAVRLHAARKLRNRFTHPKSQQVWSLGMAASVIRPCFEVITSVFDHRAKPLATQADFVASNRGRTTQAKPMAQH